MTHSAENDARCPDCLYGPATGDLIAPCAQHRPVSAEGDGMLDALLAQAKAEALRSQRDFFLAVDMPVAADHCEQAATGWDHSRAIALDPRPIPPAKP